MYVPIIAADKSKELINLALSNNGCVVCGGAALDESLFVPL